MSSNSIETPEAVETWKRAHRLVLDVYKLTNRLPKDEQHGLTPKIRTSTVKTASNIVEGYARKSNEGYLAHLSDSQAAMEETKYSLLVVRDLGYISENEYDRLMVQAEDISERLGAMHSKLSVTEAVKAPAKRGDSGDPELFGVKKGVKETASDLWAWVRGGTERLRRKEPEPRIWTEEEPVTSYLEEAPDLAADREEARPD